MFCYNGVIEKIIDADTYDIRLDLGFGIYKRDRFRLARINAYEISLKGKTSIEQKERGIKGKQWCIENLLNKQVIVETVKDKKGKYGRYLAEIKVQEAGIIHFINDDLVLMGFAVFKTYN